MLTRACHLLNADCATELAITIIMFSLGLEEDVRNFMIGIKKAWGIALIGALGPFW